MRSRSTRYRHVTFRSELEARWAVYFDALHIPWEYEPRGFEFEDESSYLPDFWLPGQRCWYETKPDSFIGDDKQKCTKLAVETATRVYVGIGIPQFAADRPLGQVMLFSTNGRVLSGYKWTSCDIGGGVGVTLGGALTELYCMGHEHTLNDTGHDTARIFTAVVLSKLASF